ncbi:MAG: SUMF1/EgtB/PvdO family nonheme iron enzyme [Geoalkalibacter sp.]|uniref:SUMF1/EgtB/PvdO family nonheme iron enzyme n=1 Tax=Geoalkalibacter sp. TaxID=3041440 RepID=UPI003D13AA79
MRPFVCLLPTLALLAFCGCAAPGPKAPVKMGDKVDKQQVAVLADLEKADRYREQENFAKARECYARAIAAGAALLPDEAYYHYGYVLNRTGDYAEAIKQLKLYLAKAGLGSRYAVAANSEMAQADTQLSLQREQARQQAEARKRRRLLQDAQQAYQPPPSPEQQQLAQRLAAREAHIIEPLTGMKLVLVTGGCYSMGDQFGDADERELAHEVCVDDFYIGQTEVTQGQWQRVMGYNPAFFQDGADYPLETVSWVEARAFLELLGRAGQGYRLPSEAEWEYAARSGGRKERFSGGADVDAVAWYAQNSGERTHPVGKKQANGLGLHDMSGNVAEWTLDYWTSGYYRISPRDNPSGPETPGEPGYRMVRGGDFMSELLGVRTSARRAYHEERERDRTLGFRVVLSLAENPR